MNRPDIGEAGDPRTAVEDIDRTSYKAALRLLEGSGSCDREFWLDRLMPSPYSAISAGQVIDAEGDYLVFVKGQDQPSAR